MYSTLTHKIVGRKDANMAGDYFININGNVYNNNSNLYIRPIVNNSYNQRLWNNENPTYYSVQFMFIKDNELNVITDLMYIDYTPIHLDSEEVEECVEHWTECGF